MRRSLPTFPRGKKSKADDAWWDALTNQDTETDDEIWESADEDAWWEKSPVGQRKAGGANKPQIKPQRPQDRLVVAVMGSTGAGKSSFVKLVNGRSDVEVGHSLHSSAASSLRIVHASDWN